MRLERPGPATGQTSRITELWAWTALDPMTDTEGILAARVGNQHMPFVGATRSLVEAMAPVVRDVVAAAEEPRPVVQLRRFVQTELDA